jgi:hypothetical protein
MAKHIAKYLERDMDLILTEDQHNAFNKVVYGEPRVIQSWPLLSVQPNQKTRSMNQGASRKFRIVFQIDLILYHGKVADTLKIQEQTHERAEAVEEWVQADEYWNFVDKTDTTKHKVIFGMVTQVDHPVVIAPENELWSASRLRLEGMSEEYF